MRQVKARGAGLLATALLGTGLVGACSDRDPVSAQLAAGQVAAGKDNAGGPLVPLGDYSVTPALARALVPGVKVRTIVSSDDALPQSPGFVFGGSADGAGLLRNADGTYTMLVNHEDNFSVSRVTLDGSFRPVRGEYLVNSTVGRYRLCSATLATPEEHGFGPLFITAGESSQESQIHAVDPFGPANQSTLLTALGRWNTENAVPLPENAYHGRTVVVIGDDDSGPFGGQLALYVSDKVGDLENGRLYVMARADGDTREKDLEAGRRYEVVFRQIENQKSLTGAQINALSGQLAAIQFGRVEDIDYRKSGHGREVYFNVTGQNGNANRTKYGRVYRLELSPKDPTRGTLELLLDGDDKSPSNPARLFQNPDNILVTRNYVYIQEDPNGYGDETHDSYVYQYDINKRTLVPVITLDHRRDEPDAAKYNVGGRSRFGAWEYGAMLDVSDKLGGNGNEGTFLVALQPHTWTGQRYRNPDGGTLRPNENQASQMVVVTGLPR
jgi:hypothetical protein